MWLNMSFLLMNITRPAASAPQAEHGLRAGRSMAERQPANEKNLSPPAAVTAHPRPPRAIFAIRRGFDSATHREAKSMPTTETGTTDEPHIQLPASVVHPVQKQLEAYNARDIDGFMQWWADDCQYYEFPSRLLADGAAEIRERHMVRFRELNLFGRLVNRLSVANLVIDQEIVTRMFPEGPGEVDVIAIYEVVNDKIAKAWFKQGPPRLNPSPT
jgi:hypothetical protein